jgi:hypothetical protein
MLMPSLRRILVPKRNKSLSKLLQYGLLIATLTLAACQSTSGTASQSDQWPLISNKDIHTKDNPMDAQEMQAWQDTLAKMTQFTFNSDLTATEVKKMYSTATMTDDHEDVWIRPSGVQAFGRLSYGWKKDTRKGANNRLTISGASLDYSATNPELFPNVSDVARIVTQLVGQEADFKIDYPTVQRYGRKSQKVSFKAKNLKYSGSIFWDYIRYTHEGREIDRLRSVSFQRDTWSKLPESQSSLNAPAVATSTMPSIVRVNDVCPTTGFWTSDVLGGTQGIFMRKGDPMPGQSFSKAERENIVWRLVKNLEQS